MKKWYLFFLTIVLIACYDDEGSYSYKELNDVTIGGMTGITSLLMSIH
jgi:hypothetical protein